MLFRSVVTWNDFKESTEFYNDFVTSVQSGLRAGQSVDQIANAYRVPAKYKGFTANPALVKANAQAIADERRK